MASLFKEQSQLSAYRDSRIPGTQEEFEQALLSSATVYVGNMSFYTTEEQVYELFTRAGEIKKIIMVLDKYTKTPCGFCFVVRDDNGVVVEAVVKGGYGKLVQKELEAQRQLVDYGAGSLESFPPVVLPPSYGRQGGSGDNYWHGIGEDDRQTHEPSKRNADYDSNRNSNPDSRPEKNPRLRESGNSDDEEEDHRKRRP